MCRYVCPYVCLACVQVIGGVIGLICCCVLVYSEVNAMLLTRDLDALKVLVVECVQ